MKQVDYIIVGCGLAGIAFCEQLRGAKKSFVVFDNSSQQSSTVAGGLYNPVILKRFTPVWKSEEQLDLAIPMYNNLEVLLEETLDYKVPVYRLFNSVEEQNNWFTASDKKGLSNFLSIDIIPNKNKAIQAPYGFAEVLQTGRIDTSKLIESYRRFLNQNNQLEESSLDYEAITLKDKSILYENYEGKQLIFAEGFGLKKNPFFKHLPLIGAKGQLITIHAPDLNIDYVLKSSVFIIPIGNDLYRIGSTYERDDKSNVISDEAKEELLTKLNTFLTCDFTVVNQVAGVRPTVKDRRPLVGKHPEHKHLYVLNGLGTRGVMIGPYVAKQLFNCIENKKPLDAEIDISRFD